MKKPIRTYGTVIFRPATLRPTPPADPEDADEEQVGAEVSSSRAAWVIQAEPHIAMRIKRFFPRAMPAQRTIELTATPEISEELRWFFTRHPMKISKRDRKILDEFSRKHLSKQSKVVKLLKHGTSLRVKMAKPPRKYQAVAADLCKSTGGLLCADEIGLGKTITGITLLSMGGMLPAVVVYPTHLAKHWQEKLQEFAPSLRTYAPKRLDPDAEKGAPDETDVWLLPYTKIAGWSHRLAGKIRTAIFDEVHELRHGSTGKYQGSNAVASQALYRMGLSATPIINYGGEFFNVLGVTHPGILGTWMEFSREWCNNHDQRNAQILDPVAFGSWLRSEGIMIRRTTREVGRELPPIIRTVIPVDWDPSPIDEIEAEMVDLARKVLGPDREVSFTSSGRFDMLLRQATGKAKAKHVAALIATILQDTGGKLLVFAWHRSVYEILLRALERYMPLLYTGSESLAQKEAHKEAFLHGPCRVLIMSHRSGQGLDGLQRVCHRVLYAELDWSPNIMDQNLGRVRRDDQANNTSAYYPVCDAGSDPIMLDKLDVKRWQHDGVIDPKGERVLSTRADPDAIKAMARDLLSRVEAKRSKRSANQDDLGFEPSH